MAGTMAATCTSSCGALQVFAKTPMLLEGTPLCSCRGSMYSAERQGCAQPYHSDVEGRGCHCERCI